MHFPKLLATLRSKRQEIHRSKFSHYLDCLKALARGEEIDADEVGHILEAAGKNDSDLESDVAVMQRRLAAAEQFGKNEAAREGFEVASRKLIEAQERLEEAYRRFQPPVEAASNERAARELEIYQTQNGESILLSTVMNVELLARENELVGEKREIYQKLRPLLEDREKDMAWLRAEQDRNADLHKKMGQFTNPEGRHLARPAVDKSDARLADQKSRIKQFDTAIQPMQKRVDAINAEIEAIHFLKLEP